MKAIRFHDYGDASVLKLEDLPIPVIAPDGVLVRVHAAGVNPIDWKIRSGAGERMGMTLPIRMGGELVGTVEQVGDGVRDFAHGCPSELWHCPFVKYLPNRAVELP